MTTIEWLNGTGTVIVMSDTDTTLDLEFDPVTADLDSSEVTCRVTSPYGTQEQSVTIAVNSMFNLPNIALAMGKAQTLSYMKRGLLSWLLHQKERLSEYQL